MSRLLTEKLIENGYHCSCDIAYKHALSRAKKIR